MSLVITFFPRLLLVNTLKELPHYLLKRKQVKVSPKCCKKLLCLKWVTGTIRGEIFPVSHSFCIFSPLLVNCFSHASLDKKFPHLLQCTRLYPWQQLSGNANTYIRTCRSIYSLSRAYLQIHNGIKWLHLHPRSTKHLKTCMQLVCFHERHKTMWLKPSMSLYIEENKLFSIRTDLVFELKAFGHTLTPYSSSEQGKSFSYGSYSINQPHFHKTGKALMKMSEKTLFYCC